MLPRLYAAPDRPDRRTRTNWLVVLLFLTAGLWILKVFGLDAIVTTRLAKLWHLTIA